MGFLPIFLMCVGWFVARVRMPAVSFMQQRERSDGICLDMREGDTCDSV